MKVVRNPTDFIQMCDRSVLEVQGANILREPLTRPREVNFSALDGGGSVSERCDRLVQDI